VNSKARMGWRRFCVALVIYLESGRGRELDLTLRNSIAERSRSSCALSAAIE